MTNFAQPVSMPCTEEQYNRDLKDGLEKLGYEGKAIRLYFGVERIIATNFQNIIKYVTSLTLEDRNNNNRHFIDHYNPELFLAIAGMREGEEVHVGEWMIAKKYFHSNGYKYYEGLLERVDYVNDDSKYCRGAFWDRYSRDAFRKATLSELITHFTKKDMPKEHEFKFGDEVLCWDEEGGTKDICRFIAYKGGSNPYVATDLDYFDNLMEDKLTSVCSFKFCEHVQEPMVLTSKMIKEAFKCDSYVIQD